MKKKHKHLSKNLITISSLLSSSAGMAIEMNSKVKNSDKRKFETLPSLEKMEKNHFGVTVGQSTKPLIFKRNNGEETVLVDGLQFIEMNYLHKISDKFQLGIMLPGNKPYGVMTSLTEESFLLGDLLIEPRYYIKDNLLFIPVFYAPTGDFEKQTGSKSGAYGAKLASEFKLSSDKTLAIQVGALFAPGDIQGEIDNNFRIQAGAGLSWYINDSFNFLAELYAERSKNNFPVEALSFIEYKGGKDWSVRAGGGTGSLVTQGSNEMKAMVGFTMSFGNNSSSSSNFPSYDNYEYSSPSKRNNIYQNNNIPSGSSKVYKFDKPNKKYRETEFMGDESQVNPKGEVDLDFINGSKIDKEEVEVDRMPDSEESNLLLKSYQAFDKEEDNFLYFLGLTRSLLDLSENSSYINRDNYVELNPKKISKEESVNELIATIEKSKKEELKEEQKANQLGLSVLKNKVIFQTQRLMDSYKVLKYSTQQYLNAFENKNIVEVDKQLVELSWSLKVIEKRKKYLIDLEKTYNKYVGKKEFSTEVLSALNYEEINDLIEVANSALDKDHQKLFNLTEYDKVAETSEESSERVKDQENYVDEKIVVSKSIQYISIKERLSHQANNLNKINQLIEDQKKLINKKKKFEIIRNNTNKDSNRLLLAINKNKDLLEDIENIKFKNNQIDSEEVEVNITLSMQRINEQTKLVGFNKALVQYQTLLKDVNLVSENINQKRINLSKVAETIINYQDIDDTLSKIDKGSSIVEFLPEIIVSEENILNGFVQSLNDNLNQLRTKQDKKNNNLLILKKKELALNLMLAQMTKFEKKKNLLNFQDNKIASQSNLKTDYSSLIKEINENFNLLSAINEIDYNNLENPQKVVEVRFNKNKVLEESINTLEKSIGDLNQNIIDKSKNFTSEEINIVKKYIVSLKKEKNIQEKNSMKESLSKKILEEELKLVRLTEQNKKAQLIAEQNSLRIAKENLRKQKEELYRKKLELESLELDTLRLQEKAPAAMKTEIKKITIPAITVSKSETNESKVEEIENLKTKTDLSDINSSIEETNLKINKLVNEQNKLKREKTDLMNAETELIVELEKVNSKVKNMKRLKVDEVNRNKKVAEEIQRSNDQLKAEKKSLAELIEMKKSILTKPNSTTISAPVVNPVVAPVVIEKEQKSESEKSNPIVTKEESISEEHKKMAKELEKLKAQNLEISKELESNESLSTSDSYEGLSEEYEGEEDSDFGTIFEDEGGVRELKPGGF